MLTGVVAMIGHSIHHLLLFLFLLVTIIIHHSIGVEVNCSLRRSCEACNAAYPKCYWADSSQCVRHCDNLRDHDCQDPWRLKTCDSRSSAERDKLERIYSILVELQNRKKNGEMRKATEASSFPANLYQDKRQHNHVTNAGSIDRKGPEVEVSSYATRKKARLLKALRLLKLIELLEAKQRATSLADLEHGTGSSTPAQFEMNQAGQHLHQAQHEIRNTKAVDSSHDLDDLLNKVNPQKPKSKRGPYISSTRFPLYNSLPTKKTSHGTFAFTTVPTEAKKFLGSTEKGVIAEESYSLYSHEPSTSKPVATTEPNLPVGCAMYEEEDNCNNNSSCSWCNMVDTCMNRNEEDMKNCYSQTKRSATTSYVIDRCLKHSDCEGCVKDSKCFWCEKSKSCHVYPFFGYVPHNCPANKWYYKDCDVQLAIFIILFPLLIILIAMIIFYFCLRYCYYRKRTLKVPLFEKPGLIEKKQGKKIYFMSGEDDDEEYRTEQIRKKYKLPVEKEPLIAP